MKAYSTLFVLLFLIFACQQNSPTEKTEATPTIVSPKAQKTPEAQYKLSAEQTHNKFSSSIPPILTVPSGSVIEAYTEEATDGQLNLQSKLEDLVKVSFDPVHPLTGPIYVEGAMPGDVLKVSLHKVELGDWGWTAIFPGFGFLPEEFTEPYLRTYELGKDKTHVNFTDDIKIPLNPFPGVMGVAPATEELLSTIPPRANGGNMDDPHLVEGSVAYFPVFVEGALFSIGDAHACQGMGEVCGTAIEIPSRIVFELELLKGGRSIREPEYETDEVYAVTAFGTTIDEAAKKATGYMVDYLVTEHGLKKQDAYALCSLAGDLQIAEVVDAPNMLVAMHISKEVLGMKK